MEAEVTPSQEIQKAIEDVQETQLGVSSKRVQRRSMDFSKLRTPEAIAEIDANAAKVRESQAKMVKRITEERPISIDSVFASIKSCAAQMAQDPHVRQSYGSLMSVAATDPEKSSMVINMMREAIDDIPLESRSRVDEALGLLLGDLKTRISMDMGLHKYRQIGSDLTTQPVIPLHEGLPDLAGQAPGQAAFSIDFDSIPGRVRQSFLDSVEACASDAEFVRGFKKALWRKRLGAIGRIFGFGKKE